MRFSSILTFLSLYFCFYCYSTIQTCNKIHKLILLHLLLVYTRQTQDFWNDAPYPYYCIGTQHMWFSVIFTILSQFFSYFFFYCYKTIQTHYKLPNLILPHSFWAYTQQIQNFLNNVPYQQYFIGTQRMRFSSICRFCQSSAFFHLLLSYYNPKMLQNTWSYFIHSELFTPSKPGISEMLHHIGNFLMEHNAWDLVQSLQFCQNSSTGFSHCYNTI